MKQHRKYTENTTNIIVLLVPVITFFLQLLGRVSVLATVLVGLIVCVKAAVEIISIKPRIVKGRQFKQKRNEIVLCPVKAKCEICKRYEQLTCDFTLSLAIAFTHIVAVPLR